MGAASLCRGADPTILFDGRTLEAGSKSKTTPRSSDRAASPPPFCWRNSPPAPTRPPLFSALARRPSLRTLPRYHSPPRNRQPARPKTHRLPPRPPQQVILSILLHATRGERKAARWSRGWDYRPGRNNNGDVLFTPLPKSRRFDPHDWSPVEIVATHRTARLELAWLSRFRPKPAPSRRRCSAAYSMTIGWAPSLHRSRRRCWRRAPCRAIWRKTRGAACRAPARRASLSGLRRRAGRFRRSRRPSRYRDGACPLSSPLRELRMQPMSHQASAMFGSNRLLLRSARRQAGRW
jgi:hypothetical protein